MVSTNRKAVVRAYMRAHGVKYTEALRALGYSAHLDTEQELVYMVLSWDEHEYRHPMGEGPTFSTLEGAKAAAIEDGDVVTTGFFAPDVLGGPERWHNYPYGNWSMYTSGVWCGRMHWDEEPQPENGWSPAWFERFPKPKAAGAYPGLANGDVAYRNIERVRFVTASGSLVTRLLPYLSDEATFARFTDDRRLITAEMKRLTATFDPRLDIRLEQAETEYGPVQYWEFETPDVDRFVSWISLDRYDGQCRSLLAEWVQDDYPHKGSINRLPFAPTETCSFCQNEPITRQHPAFPGRMIGRFPHDFESAVDVEMPSSAAHRPTNWDELLLVHLLGGTQLVSHDGCAKYWTDE